MSSTKIEVYDNFKTIIIGDNTRELAAGLIGIDILNDLEMANLEIGKDGFTIENYVKNGKKEVWKAFKTEAVENKKVSAKIKELKTHEGISNEKQSFIFYCVDATQLDKKHSNIIRALQKNNPFAKVVLIGMKTASCESDFKTWSEKEKIHSIAFNIEKIETMMVKEAPNILKGLDGIKEIRDNLIKLSQLVYEQDKNVVTVEIDGNWNDNLLLEDKIKLLTPVATQLKNSAINRFDATLKKAVPVASYTPIMLAYGKMSGSKNAIEAKENIEFFINTCKSNLGYSAFEKAAKFFSVLITAAVTFAAITAAGTALALGTGHLWIIPVAVIAGLVTGAATGALMNYGIFPRPKAFRDMMPTVDKISAAFEYVNILK